MNSLAGRSDRDRTALGVGAAGLSSLLGGTAIATTRMAAIDLEPMAVVIWRFGIGFLLFIPALLLLPRPRGRDMAACAALGLMFFTLFPFIFTLSLKYTTATRGALVMATMPLVTMVVARLLGVERLTMTKFVGIALAFGGLVIALGPGAGGGDDWRGEGLMFLGVLIGAFYSVGSRLVLRSTSQMVALPWQILFGVAGIAACFALSGEPLSMLTPRATPLWVLIYLGIAGGAVCYYLWVAGLSLTSPTRVAVTVGLNPISAALLGLWLLGEPLPLRYVVGLTLVLAGIVIVARARDSTVAAASQTA